MRIWSSITSGHGLPDDGYLMLYPLAASWVFSIPDNPFVLLRTVDLIVAATTAIALFCILEKEARSPVIAFLLALTFATAMSSPPFIQNGFKNSISAALLPLFIAVAISQHPRISWRRWSCIGAMVALSILLRESFAPFAALAVLAAWFRGTWKGALALCMGAAALALPVLTIVLAARGGIHGLLDAYQDASIVFAAVGNNKGANFVNGALTAIAHSRPAVVLFAASTLCITFTSLFHRNRSLALRALFWLAASCLPLIEPAAKVGYAYHFSVCLPGMAGLCALAWRSGIGDRFRLAAGIAIAASVALYVAPLLSQKVSIIPTAIATARNVSLNGWPPSQSPASNYLLAAEKIKKIIPDNGTLSVSGFMYPLFPLTGRYPRSAMLGELSQALILSDMSVQKLATELRNCPPDVIMTTTRDEFPGSNLITEAVSSTGMYLKVGNIDVDPTRDYGSFGGDIYQLDSKWHTGCRAY